jgi:hypothetical protein
MRQDKHESIDMGNGSENFRARRVLEMKIIEM